MNKQEVIKEISEHLNEIMDLLVIQGLDAEIKFNGEDLYSIIQDIDNEISEVLK